MQVALTSCFFCTAADPRVSETPTGKCFNTSIQYIFKIQTRNVYTKCTKCKMSKLYGLSQVKMPSGHRFRSKPTRTQSATGGSS